MKQIVFFQAFIFSAAVCFAQDKYAGTYACTNGKIHFFSDTKLEDIEATAMNAICVLNTETKKVSAKVKHESFRFRDRLMQEHFNENYMESDKYPYASLEMVIVEDLDYSKDGTYDVTLKGTLDMHGVKQEREIKGKLTIKNGAPVNATAVFIIKLADHGIKIPSVVGANIAEDIEVDVDFDFEKYKKK